MNKTDIVIIVAFLLGLVGIVSCDEESRKIKNVEIKETTSSKSTIPVIGRVTDDTVITQKMTQDCNKTFEAFFEKFARDSLFQKNRVKYPMKESYIESLDPTKIRVNYLTYEDWTYLDFTKDKNAMEREYGKYTTKIEKIDSKDVHYENLGYDNGIYIIYKFNLINGCWYMVEILDKST